MDPLMLVLRLLHILAGVFWAGAMAMLAFLLFPAIRATAPAGGQVMGYLMNVKKLSVWLNAAGLFTLLSGLGMIWHNSALSGGAWFRASSSHTFLLGGALALLGGIIGSTVNRRTAVRIAALGAQIQSGGAPPTAAQAAQMAALQTRLGKAMHTVAGLLLLAAAMMAIARYT
ncbi:hypothetical protein J421_4984 (plasmid) [Gemmatirosa kalamazoonensis]|uniref:Copper resistance protein D domain-containing protein n=1 Tax=Gemmatirosa kalamazoonensis TaxID=861299 RepID=W0RNB3_9BACT|nr:hypothetical protein [Gemmatirosa kalamazoonensis]AHG92519.1 hypothetical protein J421_4984 [Gemmatirosa kalamazoonensis]